MHRIRRRGFRKSALGGGRIFAAVGDQALHEWAGELRITSRAPFLVTYAL